jgi:hypothetical protein
MVVTMVGGPPDGAALHGRGTQQAENELADAGGLEGAVGKVAVIEAGDREHAHGIGDQRDDQGDRADTDPDDGKAGEVHADEREDA